MADLDWQELNRRTQAAYGLDAQGGLRRASGLDLDVHGISNTLFGAEPNAKAAELYALAGSTFDYELGTPIPTSASRQVATVDGANTPLEPTLVNGAARFPLTSPATASSSRRDFYWLTDDTYDNVRFYVETEPSGPIGANLGTGSCQAQMGLVMRWRQQSAKWHGVVIDNNIVFTSNVNAGVWGHNLDGTGFVNRQHASTNLPVPPCIYEGTLIGNVISYTAREVNGSVTASHTVNLDTQAGSTTGNPTPVGRGRCGLVIAHSSAHPAGICGIRRAVFSKLN